ncbi:MAG: TonB-dependent receptor [Bacteroidia bacterium]
MFKSILTAFLLLFTTLIFAQNYTISGRITDSKTGEDLTGATVLIPGTTYGVSSNSYGFYSLTLPKGTYKVAVKYIGYEDVEKTITLDKNTTFNVELTEKSKDLEEITVSAQAEESRVENKQINVIKLDMQSIKRIPVVFGEIDILKTVTMLPGVISAGEGNTGFSVRGGTQDQNLILLDEATVYNVSHLLGFFSVFNGDAIRDLDVYKGGIPPQYGGRLSSLIDIRMKEGNNKKFAGTGGVGILSSRLTLEGPIIKNKASFIVSGRRSYADIFLPLAPAEEAKSSKLFFYDFNAKINYKISDKDKLFISGYFGRDKFGFADLFGNSWGNKTATVRWNHLFNKKLFSNQTLIYSDFDYYFKINISDATSIDFTQGIIDKSYKSDFAWFYNPNNKFNFGGIITHHTFNPGEIRPVGEKSILSEPIIMEKRKALESAIYAEHEHKFSARLKVRYGLRYSIFNNLGSSKEYLFTYDSVLDKPAVAQTLSYKKNEFYNTYGGLEPRASGSYNFTKNDALKASYNRTFQYLQQTSNTASALPTDQWIPANINIKPQISDQVALGFFKNFDFGLETSVEVYYKWMKNQIDFRDGAVLFLNDQIYGELLTGKGWSYGSEFFIKKNKGKIKGFVSYTLAKSMRQIVGINDNNPYPSNTDRRHNLTATASYEITKKWDANINFVLATGNPITYPQGRYEWGGKLITQWGPRNDQRFPAYHRMDVGVNYYPNKRKKGRVESSWNFSVYNVYGRKNPYAIMTGTRKVKDAEGKEQDTGIPITEQIALFRWIPSATWNFKF